MPSFTLFVSLIVRHFRRHLNDLAEPYASLSLSLSLSLYVCVCVCLRGKYLSKRLRLNRLAVFDEIFADKDSNFNCENCSRY